MTTMTTQQQKGEKMANATAREYLQRPYARVIVPETDGTYRGEIREFPGCIALADTPAEAVAALEEVAESWIDAALEQGQSIPEPAVESEYSGKFVVRMPRTLHRSAAVRAEAEGVSLNQFVTLCVAWYLGGAQQFSEKISKHHLVPSEALNAVHVGQMDQFVTGSNRAVYVVGGSTGDYFSHDYISKVGRHTGTQVDWPTIFSFSGTKGGVVWSQGAPLQPRKRGREHV
jgi:antitoxin HicB